MATETQTGLSSHIRGVTVTTLACLAGIAAAVLSGAVVGTSPEAATNQLAVGILGAFVLVQFPVLRVVGIDVNGFGVKDYLYVVFMTFALWFITFAILLTSGVQI
ncbi:hypothetical protein C5B91_00585 [Haloferax sp. Atlit-10N]|uniref:Uncharacterized protein n=1 Tax=Haloferax prahovense (strain DSM 18310 / JCM 13924 / TL6) TaxID=1227461 RepID=M0GPH7_HALPT|nr:MULTISPECIES: hypothetical protein [Haloferax]ELZ74075.1 hypothetical protein C457_02300 [Haloferax prahovense DSM 18310]RDZ43915.1 hypothetical protein C5B86_12920 [Haloferax sp. Atlit-19N]RDZ46208.1 hypothetical protein C5B87_00585 [Haloferax sp. Atlit-16N]RDZ60041.1 hypothetical protein C5B91_00585 [Haloferax sp. Atlit-10N]